MLVGYRGAARNRIDNNCVPSVLDGAPGIENNMLLTMCNIKGSVIVQMTASVGRLQGGGQESY